MRECIRCGGLVNDETDPHLCEVDEMRPGTVVWDETKEVNDEDSDSQG